MIKLFNKTPSFCTIAPTAYLPQCARLLGSKYHLLLAHLLDPASSDEDPKYREFYARTKQQDEVYILDNGAFEIGQSYSPDRLIDIGKSVNADILVLPDYPFDNWERTREAARTYIPQFKQAGFKTFYVPQSAIGDWDGWLESFEWALFNPEIDVIGLSILALPNALPHIPKSYARVVAADRLYSWLSESNTRIELFNAKHIHWLGFLSPGLELPTLAKLGMIDTIDSSGPVWFAHCGIKYDETNDSWAIDKKHLPEVDFGAAKNRHCWERLTHNLNCVKQALTVKV